MRWGLVILGLSLMSLPALAALPPHYQRQNELIAIIAHVVEEFGISRPIESILMKGGDFYEVRGGDCRLEVRIVDMPPAADAEPTSGPRQFGVESGPLACKP